MCMNSSSLLSKPRPPTTTPLGIRPPPVSAPTNRGLVGIGEPTNPVGGPLRSGKGFMPTANSSGIEPLVGLTSQMSLGGSQNFGGMNNPLGQIVGGGQGLGPPSSPSRMFPGQGMDSGGTSSPFNPVLAAPSPSTVSQSSASSASMANIEQIRQVSKPVRCYPNNCLNELVNSGILIKNLLSIRE